MKLVLRLEADGMCAGCGRIGLVEEKWRLCPWCCATRLAVWERTEKLESTLRQRFGRKLADVGARIREQLAEFRRRTE